MSKAVIAIVLAASIVTGAAGFVGTSYVMTGELPFVGGSSATPRDLTGFVPEGFGWDRLQNSRYENSRFLAGKYVREDGDAVLYIDYEDERVYFVFELFVSESRGYNELEIFDYADIDGRRATSRGDYEISFESLRDGVIRLEADNIDEDFAPPDGVYYMEKAKYVTTPRVAIEESDRRRSGDGDRIGGGTVTPGGGNGGGDDPPPPGGRVTPSSPTPSGERPPVATHNCTPEGAFAAMVLLLQDEGYDNRTIQGIYGADEYDAIFDYYTERGAVLEGIKNDFDKIANDTSDAWVEAFGLNRAQTDEFIRDLMRAIIDWFLYFEYRIDGVDYESDSAAYVNVNVTQRVEFDFQYFMDYSVAETIFIHGNEILQMSEQERVDFVFDLVKDYLFNPWDYGDVSETDINFRLRAIKISNGCWVIDNYQNFDITDMFFKFFDTGRRWF